MKSEKSLNTTKEKSNKTKNGEVNDIIIKLKESINNKEKKINDINNNTGIKQKGVISLTNIIKNIKILSVSDINEICLFIKNSKIKFGIDAEAIKILSENKDNELLKKLLLELNQTFDIDINDISELNCVQLENVKKLCDINKIYVNTGFDEAAKVGYSVDKYNKIRSNADKMIQKAQSKFSKNAKQEDKFMALYKVVLKAEKYDKQALNTSNPEYKRKYCTARNLEGFFIDGSGLCASTASALENLCKCMGFEAEYIQGYAKSKSGKKEYHAWVRVKIGDIWYNVDPTWDANKVGKKYQYCLVSDNDFRGNNYEYHIPDLTYNPTYMRGVDVQRFIPRKINYTISEKSINRNYFEKHDSTEIQGIIKSEKNSSVNYETTREDYNYFIEEQLPSMNVDDDRKKLTIKQKIAKFFSERKYLKNIPFIKKFIAKNLKIKETSKNNNISVSNNQSEIPLVSKEQSQKYLEKRKNIKVTSKSMNSKSDEKITEKVVNR